MYINKILSKRWNQNKQLYKKLQHNIMNDI